MLNFSTANIDGLGTYLTKYNLKCSFLTGFIQIL